MSFYNTFIKQSIPNAQNISTGVQDEAGGLKSQKATFPQFTAYSSHSNGHLSETEVLAAISHPAFGAVNSPICTSAEGKPGCCTADVIHEPGKL